MCALELLYLFKEKEENNDSHPYKEENAENGFSACFHYKKIKQGVQYNGKEQPNSTGSELDDFRLVISEGKHDTDSPRG